MFEKNALPKGSNQLPSVQYSITNMNKLHEYSKKFEIVSEHAFRDQEKLNDKKSHDTVPLNRGQDHTSFINRLFAQVVLIGSK
jgi:hypothetical protein